MIGSDPVHAGPGQARAAKDIATADDHAHLHAQITHVAYFFRQALDYHRIDAVIGATHKGFAAELEEYPPVCGYLVRHGPIVARVSDAQSPATRGSVGVRIVP